MLNQRRHLAMIKLKNPQLHVGVSLLWSLSTCVLVAMEYQTNNLIRSISCFHMNMFYVILNMSTFLPMFFQLIRIIKKSPKKDNKISVWLDRFAHRILVGTKKSSQSIYRLCVFIVLFIGAIWLSITVHHSGLSESPHDSYTSDACLLSYNSTIGFLWFLDMFLAVLAMNCVDCKRDQMHFKRDLRILLIVFLVYGVAISLYQIASLWISPVVFNWLMLGSVLSCIEYIYLYAPIYYSRVVHNESLTFSQVWQDAEYRHQLVTYSDYLFCANLVQYLLDFNELHDMLSERYLDYASSLYLSALFETMELWTIDIEYPSDYDLDLIRIAIGKYLEMNIIPYIQFEASK